MKKLRKAKILGLAGLFLLLSVGVGYRIHYCHGDLASISYLTSEPHCECGDGLDEMACCATKVHFIILDDERLPSPIVQPDFGQPIPSSEIILDLSNESLFLITSFTDEVSPDNRQPKYLLYKSLIYYS